MKVKFTIILTLLIGIGATAQRRIAHCKIKSVTRSTEKP